MALLEVTSLRTSFATEDGVVRAVDDVSFSVERGRILGIVGESGSGKSVTCLTMAGLLPRRTARVAGRALLDGRDLLAMRPGELRQLRGRDFAMIFQDPMTSLNPVLTVGAQLTEAIRLHRRLPRAQAWARCRDMLADVGIPNPEARLASYPFELSGGMRQRVMIAMGLLNNPGLLVADEPTTALDVTTQAQILFLIKRLRAEFGSAVILITHDLGVVAEACDDVLVMYAGQVVERGPVDAIFDGPLHPYTWGLMGCMPRLNRGACRLRCIPGSPPSLLKPPSGCHFHPRCPYALPVCVRERPGLQPAASRAGPHLAACHRDLAFRAAESNRLFGPQGACVEP
jgi:peptide/nickel transport system ATP-binding protein